VRFEPRPEDILVALDDIVVTPTEQGVLLSSRRAGAEVKLEGLSHAVVARMLGLIDGKRAAAEIGWQGPGLERLLRASFGLMVLAPAAVETLERELPGQRDHALSSVALSHRTPVLEQHGRGTTHDS